MSRMGKVKRDLVGRRIGCLTVLDDYKRTYVNDGTYISWKCRCERCGNEYYVPRESLLKNKHEHCEKCRPAGIRHSKLYHIYHGIKQRCYNPKSPSYEIYGGKGVRMCDEWLSGYSVFEEWALSHGYVPDKGLSIERIDSNGNYCPENCEWIPLGENSARSNYGRQQVFTKLIEPYAVSPSGERVDLVNISKFCRDYGMNKSNVYAVLHGRIHSDYNGWKFHSDKTRP